MIGTQLPETCREVEINILRSSVHLVGFISKSKNVHFNSCIPRTALWWLHHKPKHLHVAQLCTEDRVTANNILTAVCITNQLDVTFV